tara:strand:- start:643 stop:786 length:144 start_codon:yes stop_codon:yes gene_type:complete
MFQLKFGKELCLTPYVSGEGDMQKVTRQYVDTTFLKQNKALLKQKSD